MRAVDAASIDAAAARAAEVFAEGGLVVLPTETVYGVAAMLERPQAFETMCRLTGGNPAGPATLHLSEPGQAMGVLDADDPALQRILRKLLSAPVTVIVEQPRERTEAKLRELGMDPALAARIDDQGAVSLRCPSEPAARRLLERAPGLVVAIGAAAGGQPPPVEADQAMGNLRGEVDLVVDAGPARHGKPSAIVRLCRSERGWVPQIVREGVLDRRILEKLLRCNILLVCTGNTCRSPMAEATARRLLAERRGLPPDELEAAGIVVRSAGVSAQAGAPASEEAVQAAGELGLDIARHRARPLTAELAEEADLIYCMTEGHCTAVVQMAPAAESKATTLLPDDDIPDPIGQDLAAYQHCATAIEQGLRQRFEEQQL